MTIIVTEGDEPPMKIGTSDGAWPNPTGRGRNTLGDVRHLGPTSSAGVIVQAWVIGAPPVWVEYDQGQRRITVGRHDGAPCELCWYDLWSIKNLVVGDEARAVEVFPERSQLVDGANCRHLWVVDGDDGPGWRCKDSVPDG